MTTFGFVVFVKTDTQVSELLDTFFSTTTSEIVSFFGAFFDEILLFVLFCTFQVDLLVTIEKMRI
jgi:hypothetical protein